MSAWRNSIALTYGIAAWIVIAGVGGTWFFLKQDTSASNIDFPNIPSLAETALHTQEDSPLELADAAFAAGRITRPAGASALDYYRQHQARHPDNPQAREGLRRVTRYLVSSAQAALLQEDRRLAGELAGQALAIDANNKAARFVRSQVAQHDTIETLGERALAQIEAGELTSPANDNALWSYRAILDLDPHHAGAQRGLTLVAQRLANLAQAQALQNDPEAAMLLIAQAREIAPDAAGIDAAEKLISEVTERAKSESTKNDLIAAARALEQNILTRDDAPGQLGALELYQSILTREPDSQAAAAGIEYLATALVERARGHISQEQLAAASHDLATAKSIAAHPSHIDSDIASAQSELAFLERRARNRAGEFDEEDMVLLSDLTIKRRIQPVVEQNIPGGAVSLAFTVAEDGAVADIAVIESANDTLDEAAIAALSRWKFEPYEIEGRPLPVRAAVRLRIET